MRQPGQIPASADLDNIVGMQRERPTLIHKQEYRLAAIALERDHQGAVRRENVRGKENLEADFDYFKEKKIDLKSLQYTQFDSDCTHYVYISDGNGNGITYYITVKDGKYKLDLRYRM